MVGRWVVAAGMLLGAAAPAAADEGPDLAAALDQARREHKPLVVELTADWCKPCQEFKSEVLTDARVRAVMDGVVFLECDVDTEGGAAIQERYGGGAVPTFLVLDADGAELHREKGYRDVDEFVELVDRAKRLAGAEPADVGEDAAALRRAAEWYLARGRSTEALDKLERAAAADPDDAAGTGATAAWLAGELRAAIGRRKEAIARAVEQVEAFPGSAASTLAVARAVLSGDLTPERGRSLLREHLAGVKVTADNAQHLHYLLYVALAADEKPLAVFAANRLLSVADEPKHHAAIAEAHYLAGDADTARERLAECASHPTCKAVAARIETGDTTSHGAVFAQRSIDAYFHNLEKPDNTGDEQRERIERDINDAQRSEALRSELARLRTFMDAVRESLTEAGSDCAEHRGQLREAWVRLRLSRPGRPPGLVTVLEPDAGDALSRCLQDSVGGRALPAAPLTMRGEYVGRVRFDDAVRKKDPGRPLAIPHDRLLREWLLVARHGHGLYEDSSLQARVFLPLSRDDNGLRPSLRLDGDLGRAGGTAYGANAMIGFATASHPAQLGLFIGGGVSRTGDSVPFAWQLPLEMSVSIDSRSVRMRAWARVAWSTGAERQRGSETAPANADELALGVGYTLPASTKRGLFFGLYFREVMGDSVGGIMLGTTNARPY